MIEVVAWGIAGSVRDAGRTGLAHVGCSRGGAVDRTALELGNRLVGNPPAAAGFETSGGLVVRTRHAAMVVVTGSPCDVSVDAGPGLGWGAPVALPAGAMVRIGRLRGGARSYVCVRGGVASVSGDLAALGPDPLSAATTHPAVPAPLDGAARVWAGPRLDWFVDGALGVLVASTWQVLPASDRIGVRLAGPPLVRCRHDELLSEGLIEGAVQVPPDGRPIVMLADHPVTGGYPVIAVVDPGDLSLIAQRPPGADLRFRLA